MYIILIFIHQYIGRCKYKHKHENKQEKTTVMLSAQYACVINNRIVRSSSITTL